MPTDLTNFAQVQEFFNQFIQQNSITVGKPHLEFWNLDYTAFVTGNVPNVVDPTNKNPIPILKKGDGAHSNIVYALCGTANTLWDPNNATGFGQMPPGGPYFTAEQIRQLIGWIDAGCPQ